MTRSRIREVTMADRLQTGPYHFIDLGGGAQAPFYIIPFDREGRQEAPRTTSHLLDTVASGDYTDLFLFSHGWNNDWRAATDAYNGFIAGYARLRRDRGLSYPRPFRPILVGVFWPSVVLVTPWEQAPQFAALPGTAAVDELQVGEERREVAEIAALLAGDRVDRFYDLVQRPALQPEEARELAGLLSPLLSDAQDESPRPDAAPTADELVQIWQAAESPRAPSDASGEFSFAEDEDEAGPGAGAGGPPPPEAAGILDVLDPRNIVRVTTVWMMKDRAGVVGARGVGPVLRGLLERNRTVRVHLVGHSYGCKVLLSALCIKEPVRKVNSILLLQPAVNYLCFAKDVQGRSGGYRPALDRVEQPILTTFSPHDVPLTTFFHLAVRRAADLAEVRIAGGVPSWYAALGGYGPGGVPGEARVIRPMRLPPDRYDLGAGAPRVYALDGTATIGGHGKISNESTWWALYNQVTS
jgi:hypothetical protein